MSQAQKQQRELRGTTQLVLEEELQKQKLEAILDLEAELADLKDCTSQLNSLAKESQPALNKIEKNVEKATNDVRKGADELKKARNA